MLKMNMRRRLLGLELVNPMFTNGLRGGFSSRGVQLKRNQEHPAPSFPNSHFIIATGRHPMLGLDSLNSRTTPHLFPEAAATAGFVRHDAARLSAGAHVAPLGARVAAAREELLTRGAACRRRDVARELAQLSLATRADTYAWKNRRPSLLYMLFLQTWHVCSSL